MKITESIVVPAYNEEDIIEKNVALLHFFLSQHYKNFELIVGDDGSTDNTYKIASHLKKKYKNFVVVRNKKNHGRGSMLTKAFREARGDAVAYVDADLTIDIKLLPELIECVKNDYDVATGSKHHNDSVVKYGLIRWLLSTFYARLSQIILDCSIKDYQCGMKAFKKQSLNKILPYAKEKGWAWDTEVLALSYHSSMKIAELPVVVERMRERKSKVIIIRDVFKMLGSLLRIRNNISHIQKLAP